MLKLITPPSSAEESTMRKPVERPDYGSVTRHGPQKADHTITFVLLFSVRMFVRRPYRQS